MNYTIEEIEEIQQEPESATLWTEKDKYIFKQKAIIRQLLARVKEAEASVARLAHERWELSRLPSPPKKQEETIMRIINKATKKVYTDLAELLREDVFLQKLKTNCLRLQYYSGWRLEYRVGTNGAPRYLPLLPDRFTVCPDDCVTKEEMREMVREIARHPSANDPTVGAVVDSIASKYLGQQKIKKMETV